MNLTGFLGVKFRWTRFLFWFTIGVILILLPWVFYKDLYRHILIIVMIYGLMSLSLNLCTGFLGQLSLGHNGFMAIGAYASALLTMNCNMPFWLGLVFAAFAGFVLGFIVGLPTFRVSGIYLGMVTLGMAEIIRLLALNLDFTKGPMGLTAIPPFSIFGHPVFELWKIYYIIAFIFFIVLIFMTNLIDSRIGEAFQAIRADELAASSMGINTGYYKVLAFCISGAIAGIAGALYAHYMTYISPSAFGTDLAILILMMIVVGGMASIPGSLVGAILLTVLPEIFRFVADYRLVIYGIVLLLMMVFCPQGILGTQKHLLRNLFDSIPPEIDCDRRE